MVLPNCKTYPSVAPFTFKFFKTVKNCPSKNSPVYCKKCDDFIWSYNVKKHCEVMHPHAQPMDYAVHLPADTEKKAIEKLFPL